MNNTTVYEFPLNERIRVFVRLEQLFLQLDHFLVGTTVWDKRAAVTILLDILTIFSRNDIKSELLKELDRHSKILNQISRTEGVDITKLEQILTELNKISKKLYDSSGKIGIAVMESELFQSISQRSSIPGGTCSFDLPAFHYWLEQDDELQNKELHQWIKPFANIRNAIDLVLKFIRQSSAPKQEIADAGFFQSSLDSSLSYQLLRVSIDKSMPCFAEISGGKHRFTVRFMNPSDENGRPTQNTNDIPFTLTRCLF